MSVTPEGPAPKIPTPLDAEARPNAVAAAEDLLRRETARRRDRLRQFLRGPDDLPARSVWRVNQVYWSCAVYAAVYVLLRAQGVGGPPLEFWERAGLSLALALGFANLMLRSRSAVRRGGYGQGHPTRWGWLFTTLDLSSVALGIRCSGGLESGLLPLLFVVVVAETVLERSIEANLVRGGVAASILLGTFPHSLPDAPALGDYAFRYATFLFFLLAVSIVTRRLRENADREKAEVASLRAELGLSEQRADLAREIHDGVGNALAASVLRLEVTARMMEKQKPGDDATSTPDLLRDEARALREALDSVRNWTFFNKPWSIASGGGTEGGPVPSVRLSDAVERLARRTGLSMSLSGAAEADAVPAAVRLALFRIVQEALTNAAKYAAPGGATGARVTLRRDGPWLVLLVEDDGPGFDPAATGTGVGMASMRERAEGLGGSFGVESAPGRGVRLSARLPAA